MEKGKRELIQRGSADFPFAHYRFRLSKLRKVTPVHWHPEQEILYVQEGAIEVTVGKSAILVRAGQVCFVPPHAIHCVQLAQESTAYHAFVFDYEVLRLPEKHFFQKEVIQPLEKGKRTLPLLLTKDAPEYAAAICQLDVLCLHSTEDASAKHRTFQALLQLYSLLVPQMKDTAGRTDQANHQAVKQCMDYMQNHCAEKLTLEQLAALVHLHPNYICKLFREYTGQTAFQYLHQLRIDKAAQLLTGEGYTVSQAAEACGFESLSFFSRKFKELTGLTPQAYRKHKAPDSKEKEVISWH